MVRGPGHGYYYDSLDEDTNGERVHGKASRVDLLTEEMNDTLSFVLMLGTISGEQRRCYRSGAWVVKACSTRSDPIG